MIGSGVLVNTAHLLGSSKTVPGLQNAEKEMEEGGSDENDDHDDAAKMKAKKRAPHIGVMTLADGTKEFIEVIPIAESKKNIRESLEGLMDDLEAGDEERKMKKTTTRQGKEKKKMKKGEGEEGEGNEEREENGEAEDKVKQKGERLKGKLERPSKKASAQ